MLQIIMVMVSRSPPLDWKYIFQNSFDGGQRKIEFIFYVYLGSVKVATAPYRDLWSQSIAIEKEII